MPQIREVNVELRAGKLSVADNPYPELWVFELVAGQSDFEQLEAVANRIIVIRNDDGDIEVLQAPKDVMVTTTDFDNPSKDISDDMLDDDMTLGSAH